MKASASPNACHSDHGVKSNTGEHAYGKTSCLFLVDMFNSAVADRGSELLSCDMAAYDHRHWLEGAYFLSMSTCVKQVLCDAAAWYVSECVPKGK